MTSHRYRYNCMKCGGKVSKPPVAVQRDKEGQLGVKHGLHGWRCDECGGPAKVKRILIKKLEE